MSPPDLLDGLKPPGVPEGLKARVLAAARQAAARPPRRNLVDRLWESRPLRLSWLGCTAGLVLALLLASSGERAPVRPAEVLAGDSDELAPARSWPRSAGRELRALSVLAYRREIDALLGEIVGPS